MRPVHLASPGRGISMGKEDHGPQHLSRFPKDKQRWREGDPLLPPMPRQHSGGETRVCPWHMAVPAGSGSRRGEMGGFNCTKPARGPLHHHRAPLAYPRPFRSMGTGEGIPNLSLKKNKTIIWKSLCGSNWVFQGLEGGILSGTSLHALIHKQGCW